MTLQESISIFKIHQQWRLGADIVMLEPKELTEAFDVLLNHHMVDETQTTSSQTEISDEEIVSLANEHILYNDSKRQWVIEGMKLYREHLKNK
jgi:hypothetical protein